MNAPMKPRPAGVIDFPVSRERTAGEGSTGPFVNKSVNKNIKEKNVRTSSATIAERTKVTVPAKEVDSKEVTPVKKIRIRECADLRRWWDEEEQDQDSCECA